MKHLSNWMVLSSAIVKRANLDLKNNNRYAEDAKYFLSNFWGDTVMNTLSLYAEEKDRTHHVSDKGK